MLFSRGKKRTILFADVSGSSALYKSEGNAKAKARIDKILKVMVFNTRKFEGRVVKTIGDEIMACFDDSEKACKAAMAIQQEVESSEEGMQLGVRIGIGFGKTIEDSSDLFGEAVNDAAFVTGIARSSQILLTDSVIAQLPEAIRSVTQEYDQVAIKGASNHSTIHRLFWKTPSAGFSDTQVFSSKDVSDHLDESHIHLTFKNERFCLTVNDTPYVIGRSTQQVSLFIDSELVSREHCQIVYRRGKFVLIDHSTNGTYIKPDEAQEIYLRREELPLLGGGTISLGASHNSDDGVTIRFEA
ncbi:adenylate/guanylate cyclase domain-containing protein [Pleionea sediminis]|uniref:adenylate/guanylate cyclase domain-containing protein n=1 Tax=Pleionea sediminis TaxID=2569479 RepID=UPI001184CAF3|nr:adenylate/guanylate cyclase domain-containing protein [Pleionea sediminis]